MISTENQRAYPRKMAVDGQIVHIDMSVMIELVKLLRSISKTVNQIARRTNEIRNFCAQDVRDLQHGYTQV